MKKQSCRVALNAHGERWAECGTIFYVLSRDEDFVEKRRKRCATDIQKLRDRRSAKKRLHSCAMCVKILSERQHAKNATQLLLNTQKIMRERSCAKMRLTPCALIFIRPYVGLFLWKQYVTANKIDGYVRKYDWQNGKIKVECWCCATTNVFWRAIRPLRNEMYLS